MQKAFIKIARKNKSRYIIIDNSQDSKNVEKNILNMILRKLNR